MNMGSGSSAFRPCCSITVLTKGMRERLGGLFVRVLLELERGVASPNEVSQALDEPLNVVAYHMRILREAECVDLVSRGQARGAVEHFYRPTSRTLLDDVSFGKLPVALRRRLVGQTLEDIWNDARAAGKDDGFDDREVHVSRTVLDLDDEGYAAVVALLAEQRFDRKASSTAALTCGEIAADRARPHGRHAGVP
jgi:DNA-binding transcriptional ArsR family regulator